jgi:hypothetical protein
VAVYEREWADGWLCRIAAAYSALQPTALMIDGLAAEGRRNQIQFRFSSMPAGFGPG